MLLCIQHPFCCPLTPGQALIPVGSDGAHAAKRGCRKGPNHAACTSWNSRHWTDSGLLTVTYSLPTHSLSHSCRLLYLFRSPQISNIWPSNLILSLSQRKLKQSEENSTSSGELPKLWNLYACSPPPLPLPPTGCLSQRMKTSSAFDEW